MPWFSLQFVHAAAVSCAACIALVSGTPEAVVAVLWCLWSKQGGGDRGALLLLN